jgi:hypothetical protein
MLTELHGIFLVKKILATSCTDCIGAGGSGRRTVLELTEAEYPYGLAITENTILWTDWNR